LSSKLAPGSPRHEGHLDGRYRVAPFEWIRLGNYRAVAKSALSDLAFPISYDDLRWLQGCRSLDTMAHHAIRRYSEWLLLERGHGRLASAILTIANGISAALRLRSSGSGDQMSVLEIERRLLDYARQGLLISDTTLRNALRSGQDGAQAAVDIEFLAVPTRDRPHLLARCLRSHIREARTARRRLVYLVADDSEAPLATEVQRQIDAVTADANVRVAYLGRREKNRLITAICGYGKVPTDTLAFALFGDPAVTRGPGGNRNAILLSTAGRAFFSADDDTLASPCVVPGSSPREFAIDSRFETRWHRFFARRADALAASAATSVDVLGAHEALLGSTLSRAFEVSAGQQVLAETIPCFSSFASSAAKYARR
jgi:hypothetical protein